MSPQGATTALLDGRRVRGRPEAIPRRAPRRGPPSGVHRQGVAVGEAGAPGGGAAGGRAPVAGRRRGRHLRQVPRVAGERRAGPVGGRGRGEALRESEAAREAKAGALRQAQAREEEATAARDEAELTAARGVLRPFRSSRGTFTPAELDALWDLTTGGRRLRARVAA